MAKQVKSASKYTPAMVAAMVAAQPLDQAKCEALAAQFNEQSKTTDFSARSLAAKASRDGLAYNRKQPVSKTGGKIEQKSDIVSDIALLVSGNLDGLDKAPKQALQAIRDYLNAQDEADSEDEVAEAA